MYVATVDAGGTRTRFELRGPDGTVRCSHAGTTCHPAQVGLDAMARMLREGVERVASAAGAPMASTAVSLGVAGYGPGREGAVETALEDAFGDAAALLVASDAEVARVGALGGADGVLVVAGTGSIAVGSFDGLPVRVGGWGWPVGDEGSGAWLGREAVGLVLRRHDGRDPAGPLLDAAVCEALAVDSPEAIAGALAASRDQRRLLARAAPAAVSSARGGDGGAQALVARAASELARLANRAAEGHPGAPVSWTGGLFSAGDAVLGPFKAALDDTLVPLAPQGTPLDGAWMRAVRALNL